MSSELKKLNLGLRIRLLREEMGKTLEEFAQYLSLTESLLKQIEKNDISPPIATLINIAHHCGRELSYFFDVGRKDQPYTLVKKGTALSTKRVLPQGKNPLSYSYKRLAPEKIVKNMEPLLVEFLSQKEKIPQVAHDGEEFVYVLSGTLECHLGKEKVRICTGDSFYFASKIPHAFKAVGGKKAKAIVVLYPY